MDTGTVQGQEAFKEIRYIKKAGVPYSRAIHTTIHVATCTFMRAIQTYFQYGGTFLINKNFACAVYMYSDKQWVDPTRHQTKCDQVNFSQYSLV